MAQQYLQIIELDGVNRNRAPGLRIRSVFGSNVRYGMPPTWLFNLGPDRQGGYRAFGYRAQVSVVDELGNADIVPTAYLIGFDEAGIASFWGL